MDPVIEAHPLEYIWDNALRYAVMYFIPVDYDTIQGCRKR